MARLLGLPDRPVADTAAAVHGTRHTALAQVLVQGVRFATSIVLARMLAPDAFGVVALASVVSLFLDQVKDMGTGAVLIQRESVDQVLLSSVFHLNLVLGAVLAGGLYAAADPLAGLLGDARVGPVLQVLAVLTFVGALGQVHHSLLRRSLRFGTIAAITSVSAMVTAVVSIALAAADSGYWSLVVGMVAGTVSSTVLAWVLCNWRPSCTASAAKLRSILGYSLHLFGSNLTFLFFSQVDKVIVGRFLGASALGIYSMAQRTVTSPVSAVGQAVSEVTFPSFSRRQDDDRALSRAFIRSSRAIGAVTWPAMVGLAVLAEPAVRVVFGPTWHDLVPVIWILAPVAAVLSVSSNSADLVLAKGRSDIAFRWGVVYCVVLTGLELAGVRWGLVGVAASLAVGVSVLVPIGLHLAFRLVGLRMTDFVKALAPQTLVTALMGAAALAVSLGLAAVDAGALAQLVVGTLSGGMVYVGLLLLWHPPVVDDLRLGLGRGA